MPARQQAVQETAQTGPRRRQSCGGWRSSTGGAGLAFASPSWVTSDGPSVLETLRDACVLIPEPLFLWTSSAQVHQQDSQKPKESTLHRRCHRLLGHGSSGWCRLGGSAGGPFR